MMPGRAATETQITHRGRLSTLFFLVAPSLVIIPLSFSSSRYLTFPPPGWSVCWYEAYVSSLEWRQATLVSFTAATLTMIAATVFGTLAAYSLHAASSRRMQALYMLFVVPMIVPAILIGVGTFILYAQLGLNNTLLGIVVAHTAMAIPLVVITVSSGLRSYDMSQERVARSLGASRPWAFLTVTLPQIRVSVISAALLAFITSLDEVVISLFIAGGDYATLTKRMFNALRDEIDPTIAAISTILIGCSIGLMIVSQTVQGPRKERAAPG
jgi:putative spermidine/putrescine transport system permease protein